LCQVWAGLYDPARGPLSIPAVGHGRRWIVRRDGRSAMHPIIRVISYLVVAVGLALGRRGSLFVGIAILTLALLGTRSCDLLAAFRGVWALRWLWCSVFSVYLAFTPGNRILPGWAVPSFEGVNEGLERVASLALIVVYVGWLVRATGREELVGGLYAIARGVGISRRIATRLAVRTLLCLEAFPRARATLLARSWAGHTGARDLVPTLASLLALVVQEGVVATPSTIRIAASGAPPPWQWLCPVVLATLFMAVQMPL